MQGSLSRIKELLHEHGTEDPASELELVTRHLKGAGFSNEEVDRIILGINSNVPITRILGYNIVCGARININSDVISPGPETVTIAEKAIQLAKKAGKLKLLDMCTGSGAVATAIAKNVNGSNCVGVDISNKALEVARQNARENGVQVDYRLGDLFEPVAGELFDLIIANPPYVRTAEIEKLPYFVRDFAPSLAIDGGLDGLRLHERILKESRLFLEPTGFLILECEDNQDTELFDLFGHYKWTVAESYQNRLGKIRGFCLSPPIINDPPF